MKKLCLILLLIPLLLCGCKKKPQDEVQPYYGEFFTQDGIAQNTGVVLVIQNETLVAPVTELSYALYDQVDLVVVPEIPRYASNNRYHQIDVYKDGVWVDAPWYGKANDLANRGTLQEGEGDPTYKGKIEGCIGSSVNMWQPDEGRYGDIDWAEKGVDPIDLHRETYYPLEAGLYRLRVTYRVPDGPEGTADTVYEAVAYFTVTAE